MRSFSRFADFAGSRNRFLAIYATTAVVAELLSLRATDLMGMNPLQLLALCVYQLLLHGDALSPIPTAPLLAVCFIVADVAPFLLIWLASVRGRRIGRRYLIVFPIFALVCTTIGIGFVMALGWILHVACLYQGARHGSHQGAIS